jgi:hypothetical protein
MYDSGLAPLAALSTPNRPCPAGLTDAAPASVTALVTLGPWAGTPTVSTCRRRCAAM